MKTITLLFLRKRISILSCIFILFFSSTSMYSYSVPIKNTTRETNSKSSSPLRLTIIKIQDATTTGICCNGKAEAIVSGGKPPYTYQWSASTNNQTTAIAKNLTNKLHHVTVTDALGAKLTACITILCINPCTIEVSNEVTNILCADELTGKIDITVSGGTPPYIYEWSNGSSDEDLINIATGNYTVTITDAKNCTITNSATIIQPNKLTAIGNTKKDILCESLGAITVNASGGLPPYRYTIDNGATFQNNGTFENLTSGIYRVTITDNNDCEITICKHILSNCTYAITDINNTFVDTPVNGNVLTNDIDLEGNTQTVMTTTVTTKEGVIVTIEPHTGMYTYTPPIGFIGEDSFEYTICDNGNPVACDTASVYIEVFLDKNPKNNPPIANPDTAITEVNTPVNGIVLVNDFDPDGDTIAVTTTTVTTTEGVDVTIDVNTGTYIYTPPNGFTGNDTFEYTICDNGNPILCDTTLVTITILNNQSNSTFANDDAYFTTCASILGNISDNDFDPEGDLQIVNILPVDNVDNGILKLNINGSFTYTPNSGYTGIDSFIYTICDTNSPIAACDQATVYITISDVISPDITNCKVIDKTIECNGTDNETIANIWNANNITELESCISDTCNTNFEGKITSSYDFKNLVSSCGSGGTIEAIYTITNKNGGTTTHTATLTLNDSIPPDLTNCIIADITLECSNPIIKEIASQWNTDNIAILKTCATDNCNISTAPLVTSDYNFDTIIDGVLVTEYIITDDCNNTTKLQARIILENNSEVFDITRLCIADDTESQIFDLFNLLEKDYDLNGVWEVVSGNASVIDNHFFDPLSIELATESSTEMITFSYTNNDSPCSIYLETTIEVHNRCAVFSCGEDRIKISKVMTPNGDSYNEYFSINGVENCGYVIDLKIINRWGAIVYRSNDYQNDWNGTAHQSSVGSANQVPSGTYYSIVTIKNSGLKPFSAPLYIGTK
ncbi:Ig-like domain-containing protein [Aquimarina longa]|uniref:Ig-like domain-containing protein n=1 Tax=Aquimarina longa TaxID=1080221 RepID=UPI0009E73AE1|nr:Ig-like domain-containing protein [Aquimarina longa]